MPVRIVFDGSRSVTATLRRLNNARGHLQFRYESRSQTDLRNYLEQVYAAGSGKGAVLRIEEVEPRVFSIEPVTDSVRGQAFLSIYQPAFHNLVASQIEKVPAYVELRKCLSQVPYREDHSQFDYNSEIAGRLRAAGWREQPRVLSEIGLRCDFEKDGLWLEVEFGNARTYYQDYIKFLLASRYSCAKFGVLLCPTNAFAQLLCELGQKRAAAKRANASAKAPVYSGMMSYEKALRELPYLKFLLSAGLVLGGIEIEGKRKGANRQ